MRKIIIFTLLLFLQHIVCFGQSKGVSKKTIMPQLITFLNQQGEIENAQLADFNNGQREVEIFGTINSYKKDELIDGVYTFFNSKSHHKTFLLLIDNGDFKILNISTLEGVKAGMIDLINFCESKKYCVEITEKYILSLLTVYYKINKNPFSRRDSNCKENSDIKDLP